MLLSPGSPQLGNAVFGVGGDMCQSSSNKEVTSKNKVNLDQAARSWWGPPPWECLLTVHSCLQRAQSICLKPGQGVRKCVSVCYADGPKVNEVWMRLPPPFGMVEGPCVPSSPDQGSGLVSGWLQELWDGQLPPKAPGGLLLSVCFRPFWSDISVSPKLTPSGGAASDLLPAKITKIT